LQNESSEFRREGALVSVLGRVAARYRIGQPSPTFEKPTGASLDFSPVK